MNAVSQQPVSRKTDDALVLLVGFGFWEDNPPQGLLPLLRERGLEPHVVINDYQNAFVDAEQLRGLAAEISAISGDCVCCGSREELLTKLASFGHLPGRLVLVETNGTTDSEMLIETLSLESSLRHFSLPIQISVIDAQRWQKRFWHNASNVSRPAPPRKFFSRAWTWSKNRDSASFVNRSNDTEFVDNPLAWRSSLRVGRGFEAARDYSAERGLETSPQAPHHHDHDQAAHHFFLARSASARPCGERRLLAAAAGSPVEVIRAKGLVRFRRIPKSCLSSKKSIALMSAILCHRKLARINKPLAPFIGSHLPERTLGHKLPALLRRPDSHLGFRRRRSKVE
jgi:G3E family GTPase